MVRPLSFFTRCLGPRVAYREDTGETVRPRVSNSFLCVGRSALRQGPMFLCRTRQVWHLQSYKKKSPKSASSGKYIPVSQSDSWTNDPSTKFIARSRVPVGLNDTHAQRNISDECVTNEISEPLGNFNVWAQRAVDEYGQIIAIPY
jgi:hypothetical protein